MNKRALRKWKLGWRKVPNHIKSRLLEIGKGPIVVACSRRMAASEIREGVYGHLQFELEHEQLRFPERVVPDERNGKASSVNINGMIVVRRDLPKVLKEFGFWAPDWGDWSNGSHWVGHEREVYQRDHIAPRELALQFQLLERESGDENAYIMKCSVEMVLDQSSSTFENDLLFCLYLLQENVGRADVFPSEASVTDFLQTIYLDWEILPPGSRDELLAKLMAGVRSRDPENLKKKLADRYDTLRDLKPIAYLRGRNGFRHYFGAQFSDDLVVFENLDYGNAAYVMYESWEQLSKRSRLDLLKGGAGGFDRVVHDSGWKSKLKQIVRKKLDKNGK